MKTYLIEIFKNSDSPAMWFVSFAGSTCTSLIGGYDIMVKVLLIFIIADYISGLIAASLEGKLSSKVGFKGIGKKVLILMLVVLGHQIDLLLGFAIIRNAIIFFYVANEIISILENVDRMGLPIPPILTLVAELLKKKASPSIPEETQNEDSN